MSMNEPLIDPRILALIVHDLRNPLNVIGLMMPVLEARLPEPSDRDDLRLIANETGQMRLMLDLLGDYCTFLTSAPPPPVSFDPRTLLNEVVDASKRGPSDRRRSSIWTPPDCPRKWNWSGAWFESP